MKTPAKNSTQVPDASAKPAEDKGWAVKVDKKRAVDVAPQKQSFLKRIAPKSRKGRVIFAAGTSQIVSIAFMAFAGMMYSHFSKKPGVVRELQDTLTNYIIKQQSPDARAENYLSSALLRKKYWRGFFDANEFAKLESFPLNDAAFGNGAARQRYDMQSGKLIEFTVMQVTDFLVSNITRSLLDKALETKLGNKRLVFAQTADTVVTVGASILFPAFFWKKVVGLKGILQKGINAVPLGGDEQRQEVARSVSFAAVNVGIPNLLGFFVNTGNILHEVGEQEKQEREKELRAEIGVGH